MEDMVWQVLDGCARCGQRHENITLRPLTNPIEPPDAPSIRWTHWAPCPINGEPILGRVLDKESLT